jgi:hypothetical protein
MSAYELGRFRVGGSRFVSRAFPLPWRLQSGPPPPVPTRRRRRASERAQGPRADPCGRRKSSALAVISTGPPGYATDPLRSVYAHPTLPHSGKGVHRAKGQSDPSRKWILVRRTLDGPAREMLAGTPWQLIRGGLQDRR